MWGLVRHKIVSPLKGHMGADARSRPVVAVEGDLAQVLMLVVQTLVGRGIRTIVASRCSTTTYPFEQGLGQGLHRRGSSRSDASRVGSW